MPRRVRSHIPADARSEPSLAPKHLTKQEFGRRLYRLMINKRWTQSELARKADMSRDNISRFVRGTSLPTPQSLEKLAKALGVNEEELFPNQIESAIDADNPSFEFKESPGMPGVAWIRVNRLVTIATALKIADLLSNDNAAIDRK